MRRLAYLSTAISFALLASAVVLWIVSYHRRGIWELPKVAGRHIKIDSQRGWLRIQCGKQEPLPGAILHAEDGRLVLHGNRISEGSSATTIIMTTPAWERGGLEWSEGWIATSTGSITFERFVTPGLHDAYLVATAVILPAIWTLGWRQRRGRRRMQRGCCPRCGYDLRATRDCCPECGATAAQAGA